MLQYNLLWGLICLLPTGIFADEGTKCPEPTIPRNGVLLLMDRKVGGIMTITCNDGYKLSGADTRTCRADGEWSSEVLICNETLCTRITDVKHGTISSTDHSFMASITVQCDAGFILEGFSKSVCLADGQWSQPLGQCIKQPISEYWFLLLLLIIPILVIGILIWNFRRKVCRFCGQPQTTVDVPEQHQLISADSQTATPANKGTYHCRLKLSDPLPTECATVKIQKAIQDTLQESKDNGTVDVLVKYLSQKRKEVFFYLKCEPARTEEIQEALSTSGLTIDTVPFRVVPGTLHFTDEVAQTLALKIIDSKHMRDKKEDRMIDLETQYVRLKIMTEEQIAEVERDAMEAPDKYQANLEKHTGKEITDEEILKPGEVEKFILIRGRAGIGKTTLVQRLLLRWAHREWATELKAIFFLNLRNLMSMESTLTLSDILQSCTAYGNIDIILKTEWLEKHQQHICIILDGLDELHDFIKYWKRDDIPTDLNKEVLPVLWGISLMKRKCLRQITLIVTSRPFTALSELEKKTTMLIELMGLTRERVIEFVDKNAPEERKEMVKKTLKKSPFLMSVCSITFYCTTLCQVLEKDIIVIDSLDTYTMITAYIIEMSIHRSTIKPISGDLSALCQLAYSGLAKGNSRKLLKLVFDEDDLKSNNLQRDGAEVSEAKDAGLFFLTDVADPKSSTNIVIGQFVHLSIQEFLAMLGLLSHSSEEVKETLRSFSVSGQYNMALLFLYGLAFNTENEQIKKVFKELGLNFKVTEDICNELIENVKNISEDLQALQIIHESQSPVIAVRVGEVRFKEEVHLYGAMLTIVDVLALTFLLKYHHTVTSIDLQGVGLDPICIKELAKILRDNDRVEKVTIIDDGINHEGMAHLAPALKENKRISFLKLGSVSMGDEVVTLLTTSLEENSTLKRLELQSPSISDKGVDALSFLLRRSPALSSMTLSGYSMKDAGATAILQALTAKKTASVTMWPPHCNDTLKDQLKHIERVTFKY